MSSIRQVGSVVEYHLQALFDELCDYDDIYYDLIREYLAEIDLAHEWGIYID